jgi:hypothetical protein
MTSASSPKPAASHTRSFSRRNRRSLVLLVATGILAVLLFGAISRVADFPILDTLWWASPAAVRSVLESLSTGQRDAYRLMLLIDYLYAGAYATFLVVALDRSRPKDAPSAEHQVAGASKLRRLIFRTGVSGAVLTGTLDAIENSMALILLARLPQTAPLEVAIGPVTSLKWVAAGTAGSVLLVQLLLRAGAAVRRRIRP